MSIAFPRPLPETKIHRIDFSTRENAHSSVEKRIIDYATCERKYEYHPITKQNWSDLKDRNEFQILVFSRKTNGKLDEWGNLLVGLTCPSEKEEEEYKKQFTAGARVHFLFFFYRKTGGQEDIYAATTGEAYRSIQEILDYSFSKRIAKRIVEPESFVTNFETPIGNVRANKTHYRHQVLPFEKAMFQLVRGIESSFKLGCSLYDLPMFDDLDGREKIHVQINKESVRLRKKFTILELTGILDYFSDIYINGNKYDKKGEIEDERLDYLDTVRFTGKYQKEECNRLLIKSLYHFFTSQKNDVFYLCHKFYDDFMIANEFQLRQKNKRTGHTWGHPPSFEEFCHTLKDKKLVKFSSKEAFSKSFQKLRLDYNRHGKTQSFPILDFIEGEIFDEKVNYFRLESCWFSLSDQYIINIHEQFSDLIKGHILSNESFSIELEIFKGIDNSFEKPYFLERDSRKFFIGSELTTKSGNRCFNVMECVSGKIYLYFLKKGIIHASRQLHSEIQDVGYQLYTALDKKQALNGTSIITQFYDEAKINEISKFTKQQFIELFEDASKIGEIHFVATLIDISPVELEREKQVRFHWTVEDLKQEGISNPEEAIINLHRDGYLKDGYLTNHYFQSKKKSFPYQDLYPIFEKYSPKLKSIATKANFIAMKNEIEKYKFHFHIFNMEIDPSVKVRPSRSKMTRTPYSKERKNESIVSKKRDRSSDSSNRSSKKRKTSSGTQPSLGSEKRGRDKSQQSIMNWIKKKRKGESSPSNYSSSSLCSNLSDSFSKNSNELNTDTILERLVGEYPEVAVALVLCSKLKEQEEVVKVAIEEQMNTLPPDIKNELKKLIEGKNLHDQLVEIADDIYKTQKMVPFGVNEKARKIDAPPKVISNNGEGLRCGYFAMGAGVLQLSEDSKLMILEKIGFNNQLLKGNIEEDQYTVGDQLFRYSIRHNEIFTGPVQTFINTMVAAFNRQRSIGVVGQYDIDGLNQTISQIQEDIGADINIYADRIQILGNHLGINCYINDGIYGGRELGNAPRIDIYNSQGGHYESVDRRSN